MIALAPELLGGGVVELEIDFIVLKSRNETELELGITEEGLLDVGSIGDD